MATKRRTRCVIWEIATFLAGRQVTANLTIQSKSGRKTTMIWAVDHNTTLIVNRKEKQFIRWRISKRSFHRIAQSLARPMQHADIQRQNPSQTNEQSSVCGVTV